MLLASPLSSLTSDRIRMMTTNGPLSRTPAGRGSLFCESRPIYAVSFYNWGLGLRYLCTSIFIETLSLEGLPAKTKKDLPLDINPVFPQDQDDYYYYYYYFGGNFWVKNLSNGLKIRFFKFCGEGKRDIFYFFGGMRSHQHKIAWFLTKCLFCFAN